LDPAAERVIALLHERDYPFLSKNEPRAMSLPDMVSRAIQILERGQPKGWVLVVEGSFVDWCAHNLDGACAAAETLDLDAAVIRAREFAATRDDTLVVATADHETAGMSVIDPYYSDRFSKLLGGEAVAARTVARPSIGELTFDSPPPFQHFAIGSGRFELHSEALPGRTDLFGMNEAVDGRATVVSGHFSTASRPLFKQTKRFYAAHSPTMVTIHAEGPGADLVTQVRDNARLGRAIRELVVAGATRKPIAAPQPDNRRPKNVVLMIGDGMGLPAITAAHYTTPGVSFVELPSTALLSTHAVDYLVNDSAATATALATGERTRKRVVGKVVRDGALQPADTVLLMAERAGLATGIVTTTPVTHATPAAFYAHQDTRYEKAGIAADLVSMPQRAGAPEVVIGGGAAQFADGILEGAGYEVFRSWPPPELPPDASLVGLLADDGLAPAATRLRDDDPATPTLADLTRFALNRLQSSDAGFFLLVEGGQIDWRLHEGVRDMSVVDEVVDFDRAAAEVTAWARDRGDTLVIVTADHDHTLTLFDNHYAFESGRCGVATQCGGPMELLGLKIDAGHVPHSGDLRHPGGRLRGDWAAPELYLQYAWPVQAAQMRGLQRKPGKPLRAPHSANFVPLFATGPWSDRLRTMRDQPEVGVLLKEWAITGKLE
jgi:alkaline phosphatase